CRSPSCRTAPRSRATRCGWPDRWPIRPTAALPPLARADVLLDLPYAPTPARGYNRNRPPACIRSATYDLSAGHAGARGSSRVAIAFRRFIGVAAHHIDRRAPIRLALGGLHAVGETVVLRRDRKDLTADDGVRRPFREMPHFGSSGAQILDTFTHTQLLAGVCAYTSCT